VYITIANLIRIHSFALEMKHEWMDRNDCPNIVVEWLPLLPHILEVADPNLGPETSYPN
jgi:hypothetical protein